MKRIAVNNGGFIEMENTGSGVNVAACDSMGHVERRDRFSDGEIVMALNLLRYMKDRNIKRVWIAEKNEKELFRNDSMIDFQIF